MDVGGKPQKRRENKETQFNSNLLSNQEPPLLLPQSHLPTAKSIQAQPLHSDTDKRVVTWNMFIYSQSPLEHEDGCFKLILCKGTNCQGKAFPCYSWMHPDMEIFQCSQGLYRDFCPAWQILDYYGDSDQGFRQHTEMFCLLKAIIL